MGATVVVDFDLDLDHCILVVYVCTRQTTPVDVSTVRVFAVYSVLTLSVMSVTTLVPLAS